MILSEVKQSTEFFKLVDLTMADQESAVDSIEQRSRSGENDYSDAPNLFFRLPRELRDVVYTSLLTNYDQQLPTFGYGSGIDIAVLMLNKSTYAEALPILYNTPHKLTLHDGHLKRASTSTGDRYYFIRGASPPSYALKRMQSLSVAINFATTNRGEAELSINHAAYWEEKLLYIGISILRSETLHTLALSLWNGNQRKVGAKRLRSHEVKQQMRAILRPFAFLPRTVNVLITGFDTIEYFELFEEMRNNLAGREMSVEEMMSEVIPLEEFICPQPVDPRTTTPIAGRWTVVRPEWRENHIDAADMSRLL